MDVLYSGWRLQRLQARHHPDSGSRGLNRFNEVDLSYGTGAEHFRHSYKMSEDMNTSKPLKRASSCTSGCDCDALVMAAYAVFMDPIISGDDVCNWDGGGGVAGRIGGLQCGL